MKQVLLNLIFECGPGDAGGRSPDPHGDCGSRAEPEGPEVQLTVTDTGIGIPLEVQSQVFDPFFTTKDEGQGLGLAIVHALVEAHHGRIDVVSSPGRGTAFVMTLPQEPNQLSAGTVAAATQLRQVDADDHSLTVAEEEMAE